MYKEHWAYKRIKELGYITKVSDSQVQIFFDDGELYADFRLKKDEDIDKDMYFIFLENHMINDEIDFYHSYDEAVESCFYYFLTRF